jgi:hypothetical protein
VQEIWNVCGRRGKHVEFLVENPEPNNHLEDLGVIKTNLTAIG